MTKKKEVEQPPPTPTGGPKVIRLLVSVGDEDDRTVESFLADMKRALVSAGAKNVTSLGGYYLVNGQPVRSDGSSYLSGEADPTTELKPEPGPEPPPEAEKAPKPESPPGPKPKGISMRKKED
jgi:hypothetical protein